MKKGNRGEREAGPTHLVIRDRSTKVLVPIGQVALVGRVDFATWHFERRINEHGLQFYQPLPVSQLTPVDFGHTSWEKEVLDTSDTYAKRLAAKRANEGKTYPDISQFPENQRVREFMHKSIGFAKRLLEAPNDRQADDITRRRRDYLGNLARDLRGRQRFTLMRDLVEGLGQMQGKENLKALTCLTVDTRILYLLLGTHNKFLAGVSNGQAYWKNVEMPPVYEEMGIPFLHVTNPYINVLDAVGDKHLAALPKKIIAPADYKKIDLPEPRETLGSILEDVYHHQRYTLRERGVAAKLVGEGDVQRMVLVESAGTLYANAQTPYGDLSVVLNLDKGQGLCMDLLPELITQSVIPDTMTDKSRLAVLVGEVYRDFLCAREIRTSIRSRRGKTDPDQPGSGKASGRRPGQAVLSKVVMQVEGEGSVVPRDTFKGIRPPKFREVSGYPQRRPTGISGDQEIRVAQWKARTGLTVPSYDPATETLVLPYTVPKGMEHHIREMPEYLRKRHQDRSFSSTRGFVSRE